MANSAVDAANAKPLSSTVSKVIGIKQPDTEYVERLAVRIITSNDKNEIIIIYVKKGTYYKLPGGGIEADEDHGLAGQREVLEETGCKVVVERECMAITEEWRNDLHQMSYCYRARLTEDTGRPELTELETSEGLKHEWVEVETALTKMGMCEPTSELGQFIKERDIFLLEQYGKNKQ